MTESIQFFCGSTDLKLILISSKLESLLSYQIKLIRDNKDQTTESIRKYLSFLIEKLSNGKLLTPKDHLLITYSIAIGVVKIIEVKSDNRDLQSNEFNKYKEQINLENRELQRRLENSTLLLEEFKLSQARLSRSIIYSFILFFNIFILCF